MQSFARELVSSLQFYQNQPGSLGIGEIVLTGGTTGLPGLADKPKKLVLHEGIKAVGRLVEHQHFGVRGERQQKGDLATIARG